MGRKIKNEEIGKGNKHEEMEPGMKKKQLTCLQKHSETA